MYSEITFQLIVESSPNAIILINKEGNVAYLNQRTEKLFGYQKSEIMGKSVETLIPERFRNHHPAYRDSFFRDPGERGMGVGRDLYALRKDQTEFPVEIGLSPIVTMTGTMVLASIIDITERKRAEEMFRLVVEYAPNAMVLIDTKGVIIMVNPMTEVLFGYTKSELLGQMLETLIPERFREQHPGLRDQFFLSPKSRSMGAGRNLFALRKDGTEVQVEIGLNPIESPEGMRVLASIIDITERKQKEQFMTRQAELEAKNKELAQFAYVASHDLQEPLRTVANYIQMFEEDFGTELDETGRKYLKAMNNATTRMSGLVKSLLEYARLGKDRKLSVIDCNRLLAEVLDDMRIVIDDTHADIKIGHLPEIMGYETELRQLFQNLISNAIKYVKAGTAPRIEVSALNEDGKWKFRVSDRGLGIAPVYYEKIFQIFQRLHTRDEYEGNGIGLSLCKKIAEMHGGEIWVESREGEGTDFFFTISSITI